jgi:hypothetical protein
MVHYRYLQDFQNYQILWKYTYVKHLKQRFSVYFVQIDIQAGQLSNVKLIPRRIPGFRILSTVLQPYEIVIPKLNIKTKENFNKNFVFLRIFVFFSSFLLIYHCIMYF